ncbi:cation diffusion facilitator family transporter [Thiotrichales bacterium 19S3-7]|nr:cation diffusion facilitator family transporter [Thiotrichales bacterium 19S3-7]MCF6801170.1 cation diffusion facilitator family transporter [Thiotrichales bacterium 19S3-11]
MYTKEERYDISKRVTLVGSGINLGLAVLKLIVGFFGHSSALFADGLHSLSDLFGDFLVLMAAKFAKKGADHDHPYGHHRIETIATVGLGLFLIIIGLGIIFDAIIEVAKSDALRPDYFTLVVAIISIIANEWLYRYTMKAADEIHSDLLRANAWHSRSDSLSSIIVLVGLIGSLLGWHFMDPIAAIIVSLMIIKMGIKWGWRGISELVDTAVDPKTIAKIDAIIAKTEGVRSHHQTRTRLMAGHIFLDAHILIDPLATASEGHYIAERIRARLASEIDYIEDVTIHIDVDEHPERLPSLSELPPTRMEILSELMPKLKTLIPENAIQRVDLYYTKEKVNASVILNTEHLSSQGSLDVLKAQIKKIAREIRSIHTIQILYLI